MKTRYYSSIRVARLAALAITLPIQMLPIAEGATIPQDIEVEDIKYLDIRFLKNGVSGLGTKLGTEGDARYKLDGGSITIYLPEQSRDFTLTVKGTYGEIGLNAVISAAIATGADEEITLNTYIFDAIAAGGGGADYKTDIYMDGAGRVILERLSDGSTLLLDEHENPILKRNADGSTQFFDAYQSARMTISENGDINFNGNVSGAGMDQYILGLQGGKFVHGTEQLTFAQIKAAVEDVNKFVYLDFANAFHLPSFIVDTEGNSAVAFSSAFTIDGKPHIERVVINEQEDIKVDNYTMLALNEDGGVAFGDGCDANIDAAFAHGTSCHAEGEYSHAEGGTTTASGYASHAEGDRTIASGDYSHAEGYGTTASGEYSHADGVFNNPDDANEEGSYSHGCGTSSSDLKNSVLFVGDKVYILGVGGYDGTNHTEAQDLATVLAGL